MTQFIRIIKTVSEYTIKVYTLHAKEISKRFSLEKRIHAQATHLIHAIPSKVYSKYDQKWFSITSFYNNNQKTSIIASWLMTNMREKTLINRLGPNFLCFKGQKM